jgi:hypothetical protein
MEQLWKGIQKVISIDTLWWKFIHDHSKVTVVMVQGVRRDDKRQNSRHSCIHPNRDMHPNRVTCCFVVLMLLVPNMDNRGASSPINLGRAFFTSRTLAHHSIFSVIFQVHNITDFCLYVFLAEGFGVQNVFWWCNYFLDRNLTFVSVGVPIHLSYLMNWYMTDILERIWI